jgi:two-component system response regulator WspF
MRVGIVNDMALARTVLAQLLDASDDYDVAWLAEDGRAAVERVRANCPDVVLMDLHMPVMDGVEATRVIAGETSCPVLIVTGTIDGSRDKVFEALAAGALDAVETPVWRGEGPDATELLLKLDRLRSRYAKPVERAGSGDGLVAIGASSGGPGALSQVLGGLPRDFPWPVVVVQHIDNRFAGDLCTWLDGQVPLPVQLIQGNERLDPGRILLAGGERHVQLSGGRLRLTDEPTDAVFRPSVDVFFRSVATSWRKQALGVLLTGMGSDGALGLLEMRRAGMSTIAQDEASCVVYGMPRAAVELDAAERVLPLGEIPDAIVRRVDFGAVGATR